jgi:heat shock protein HslJ
METRALRRLVWPLGLVALSMGILLALPALARSDGPGGGEGLDEPTTVPAEATGEPVAPLIDTVWEWQQTQQGDGTTIVANEPSRYTVLFRPDGTLAIRADCNRVGGSYRLNGADLQVELGAGTLIGCPPDSQADQFLGGLSAIARYRFGNNGGQLLADLEAGRGTMVFAARRSSGLAGPIWQLQEYDAGQGASRPVLAQTQVTAEFGSDGRLSGSTGCNRYQGSYRAEGATIAIGPLATTRRGCDGPIMEQEQAYLAILQAATSYRLEGERLTLTDPSGTHRAVFVV